MVTQSRILILIGALLVAASSSSANPLGSPPGSVVPLSWLHSSVGCSGTDALVPASRLLPATPFDQRQEKEDFCYSWECEDFCVNVCYACGGYPFSQCVRHEDGVCRAICWCNIC